MDKTVSLYYVQKFTSDESVAKSTRRQHADITFSLSSTCTGTRDFDYLQINFVPY